MAQSAQSIRNNRRSDVGSKRQRLGQVHNTVKQGLITPFVQLATKKGVSAYVGNGLNRWAAGCVSDNARPYCLALDKSEAGYHAVGEEDVLAKDIATVISHGLKVPVVSIPADEAKTNFGWLSIFAGVDLPASSARTQPVLGWLRMDPDSF